MTGAHKILQCLAFGLALIVIQCNLAQAQSEVAVAAPGFEARGGFVNFVEGSGRCICAKPAQPQAKQPLTKGDTVELEDGRAEIVLAPGYYVRFSDHTVARLLDLATDNLKIELLKGSAIVEITIEPELPYGRYARFQEIHERLFNHISLVTPSGEFAVVKAGGYRFDVTLNNASTVRVLKGSVAVSGRTVGEGDVASVMAGAVDVHNAGKHVDDGFDSWSRSRAVALVESNKSLKQSDWYKKMRQGGYLDIPSEKPAAAVNSAHVVSARSGLMGFVEDGVSIKSAKADWHELESGAALAAGDRVRTPRHVRAEILPYPDFDLCLDGSTEIIYSATDDGSVSIGINRGSVALVVLQSDGKHVERNTLKLSVNHTDYTITANGYYRLNVFTEDDSEMLVYSGAVIGPEGEVGSAKRIRVHGQSRSISSLDKDSRDSFDVWTRHRDALNRFGDTSRRTWPRGLWFLVPATSEYTFVPAEQPWKSPYGGAYSTVYLLNHERLGRPVRSERPRFPDR